MEEALFRGTRPVIYSTNPEDPENGRTFVWAWTDWFERIEGDTGAVVFTPVAETENQLREMLYREKTGEISVIDDEYADTVFGEFMEQVPLFPEAPETSTEPAPGRHEDNHEDYRDNSDGAIHV